MTEDVLTRAVGELRRLFGDDAARPRVIETIRKSGYRLIAPLSAAPSEAGEPATSEGAPEAARAAGRSPLPRRAAVGAALLAAAGLAAFLFLSRERSRPQAGRDADPARDFLSRQRARPGGLPRRHARRLRVERRERRGHEPLRRAPRLRDAAASHVAAGGRGPHTRLVARRAAPRLHARVAGGLPDPARLGARRRASGRSRRAATRTTGRVAWSPDGRWLALSRRGDCGSARARAPRRRDARAARPDAPAGGHRSATLRPRSLPTAGRSPSRATAPTASTTSTAWAPREVSRSA